MGNSEKIIKFMKYAFWIIIVIILLYKLFSIFEPLIVSKFADNDSVTDDNILNELTDCTSTYVNAIKNKQYIKANSFNYFFNTKSNNEYESTYNKIIKTPNYKIIIKKIYRLSNETYRCYYLIEDKATDVSKILGEVDNNLMNVITIRLDINKNTFMIFDDLFR